MNAIFEIKQEGTVEIRVLNDCNCEEIEEAQDKIIDLLENWLYENDLEIDSFDTFKGKLIYLDDMDDFCLMKEWDGFDGNSCGVLYEKKIYSLWDLACVLNKEK